MTTFRAQIKNVVAGDDLTVLRTVQNIPAGQLLATAYFTLKVAGTDADPGLFQKIITPTPGVPGQITDTGASGTGTIQFELADTDTILCVPEQSYYYDIQVVTDAGKKYTVEVGTARFKQGVTAT